MYKTTLFASTSSIAYNTLTQNEFIGFKTDEIIERLCAPKTKLLPRTLIEALIFFTDLFMIPFQNWFQSFTLLKKPFDDLKAFRGTHV